MQLTENLVVGKGVVGISSSKVSRQHVRDTSGFRKQVLGGGPSADCKEQGQAYSAA